MIRLAACLALLPLAAPAATVDGFAYAVASAGRMPAAGTHFHASTVGTYGEGVAEVGSYLTEEVRGLAEFNLAGLAPFARVIARFRVAALQGLFAENAFAYAGPILVEAYAANGREDIADYATPTLGPVGTIGGLAAGETLALDVTRFAAGLDVLGLRLSIAGRPNGGAITFDRFRLAAEVPLPPTLPLLGGALLVLWRRRG